MIVAIDGPAGAGKSTVAKRIAQKLGFLYIDTGAMYRALTLAAIESSTDIKNIPKIIELAHEVRIDLINNPEGSLKVLLNGRDVSAEIRQPRITQLVSDIAKIKEVREVMLHLQRKLGKQSDSILDGRDIGTVVFPDADRKFYLDAHFDERTNRRYKEMKDLKHNITVDNVAADLSNRDTIDSTREHAPLKKADDAIYVDTTHMTIDQVVDRLLKEINAKS